MDTGQDETTSSSLCGMLGDNDNQRRAWRVGVLVHSWGWSAIGSKRGKIERESVSKA